MPFEFPVRQRLPLIFQNELAECGLASLAMVAAYHGHNVDMNGLRQRYAVSLQGATLEHLISIAETLGLGARPMRAEMEHLEDLRTPCILHWDLNHFVVLKGVRGGRVTIHDPARGVRVLTYEEVSKSFTGVVLELEPVAGFERRDIRLGVRLSDLWSRMTGWKRSLAQTLVLSAMLQMLVLAAPLYLQLVIDEAVPRFDGDMLVFLAVLFGALFVLQGMVEGLRSWVILNIGQMMTYQMVGNLLRHLLRLPVAFFEKRFVGDILTRLGSTQPIQEALTKTLVAAIIDGLTALVALLILFVYSATLGAVVLASVLLYAAVAFALFPRRRVHEEEVLVARAEERSHLIETIRASTTIKLFGRESEREAIWRNFFGKLINAGLVAGRLEIAQKTTETILMGLQQVLVVLIGGLMIMAGDFTVGMLFAVMLYRANFTERAIGLVEQAVQFRLLGLHLDRLADIVHAGREPSAGEGAMLGKTLEGGLTLEQVSFRYSERDPFVFKDVTFDIAPGDFVAIVGPSGGGKTTLLKVLLGLYPPSAGHVKVDGVPVDAFGVRAFRAQIGVVQQDDQLFAGTIADNISIFDPDIDMVRVQESAKKAMIHEDIMAMPMNYLGLVGDMGSALSGGQRQRILIARALYRNPRLLVLDEGTANLDMESESEIAALVESLDITRIVIAHRPELVRRAAKVFEMRGGTLRQTR